MYLFKILNIINKCKLLIKSLLFILVKLNYNFNIKVKFLGIGLLLIYLFKNIKYN